jgi:tetratricopeptide (TPR) repeat protein
VVNPEALLITNEYVREALDQIIQVTSGNTTNPLQFLHLIDSHMLTSDFTFFQEPRKFALNDLLISTIHVQYILQRRLHEFAPVEIGMTLLKATEVIVEDATTGNSDLIGWSWVYFHYVEINLRITQQQFCHTVNLDDRTIRRYQNNTIDQLTRQLVGMEQDARETRRKQTLYFQLPHQGTISDLLDREKEFQLVKKSTLRHFNIVGMAGIGKTVFVEQIVKELIDSDEFDRLVWIHSPENFQSVKSYLRERLLSTDSKITLVEYMSLKKTTIVIDNAENLQEDLVQLQAFLQEFSNANIFLTSRLFHPVPNCLQVYLPELPLPAIERILSLRKIEYDEGFEAIDYVRLIWQSVGGNPLAAELLAQNGSVFGFQTGTLLTLDQLFSRLFDSLTESERLAWLILAFLSDTTLNLTDLSEITSSHIAFADFMRLVRLCIARTASSENAHISITVSASQYIQMRYTSSVELQFYLDQLVADMMSAHDSEIDLVLIESILSAEGVLLNGSLEMVQRFWKLGLHQGHYTKWYIILGKVIDELTAQNLDLAIGLGICQRCLGDWSQAHSVFNAVVQFAGAHGIFFYQAEALLELVTLLRYQGDYAGAIEALNHINSLTDTYISNLRYRMIIERIEMALENNNLDDAKSLLRQLPNDITPIPRLILQLEIRAKGDNDGNDLPFLTTLSDKLLSDFSYNQSSTARVHILISRIYQKISDVKSATRHLTIAQSVLMDIDNDPFALARTQSNLAALLITLNQVLDARELLKSAENIQRKIGDRVGLAVTMHNEHALNRKIVN